MEDYLYPYCEWCKREIKQNPAFGTTDNKKLTFCDIFCAKLYNDNISKIDFNFDSFTRDYYRDNSKKLVKIYERCKDLLFEELPIYTVQKHESPEEMKDHYEALFMHL